MSSPVIQIGASKDTIVEARAAINDILGSAAEEKTKREAIRALATLAYVEQATITNSTIYGAPPVEEKKDEA